MCLVPFQPPNILHMNQGTSRTTLDEDTKLAFTNFPGMLWERCEWLTDRNYSRLLCDPVHLCSCIHNIHLRQLQIDEVVVDNLHRFTL